MFSLACKAFRVSGSKLGVHGLGPRASLITFKTSRLPGV